MRKITKYSRRMKLRFAEAAIVAGTCIMIAAPWSKGIAKADENYYSVMVNGNKVGNVLSSDQADEAYAQARTKLMSENVDTAYIESTLEIKKDDAIVGKCTDAASLEANIYQELSQSLVAAVDTSYELVVDGTTVVLSSVEEVSEVLNTVKDQYDVEDKYQAVITETKDDRFASATCELVQASIEPVNKPIVMASEDGSAAANTQADTDISFDNNIQIRKTYADSAQILSVEEAIEALKPEIAVVSVSTESYVEEILFATEVVEDAGQYSDYVEVIQVGVNGSKNVTAQVTYDNGVETGRTVLSEEVTAEPVNQVMKVGTLERPEYALPLKRPVISDVYGPRWGTVHWGMDFSCSTGTDILAAADGTVTEAMWRNDYGYTIVITHNNGTKTRYAHMSQLIAEEGDVMSQGDVIGLSGNTGNSTGPHLHFEVIVDGYRVDPYSYLYE